jgi:phytoene synthase
MGLNKLTPFSTVWKPGNRIASAQDYAVCKGIMRSASKNYSFASRFLPAEKLHHVEALYALLRVGDDRVDVTHEGFASPMHAIEDWEESYFNAFERGDSSHPVMRAYLNTAVECGIPADTMMAYFQAMEDDVHMTMAGNVARYETFADLVYYMQGSAIPVGRAMTHILGVRPPYRVAEALTGADSLSIAMQLSNFWRDIGYDWNIRRIYLPQEDLQRFGYTEADLAGSLVTPNFINLLEFEFERTERYYTQARESVPMLAAGRWAVMSGLEVYRAILQAIRRNRYDVFTRRAGATRVKKLGLALRSYWSVSILSRPSSRPG